MRTVPRFLLVLGLFAAGPAFAQSQDQSLARWKIEVRAYGSGSTCGVYRRLGPALELGLGVSGGLDQDSSEQSDHLRRESTGESPTETDSHSETEGHDVSIQVAPELRKWSHRTSRLSVYWGSRVFASYGRGEDDTTSPATTTGQATQMLDAHRTSQNASVGIGATCGAALRLTEHLAASMSLQLASFSYRWSRTEEDRLQRTLYTGSAPRIDVYDRHEVRTSKRPTASLDVSPGLCVVLDF